MNVIRRHRRSFQAVDGPDRQVINGRLVASLSVACPHAIHRGLSLDSLMLIMARIEGPNPRPKPRPGAEDGRREGSQEGGVDEATRGPPSRPGMGAGQPIPVRPLEGLLSPAGIVRAALDGAELDVPPGRAPRRRAGLGRRVPLPGPLRDRDAANAGGPNSTSASTPSAIKATTRGRASGGHGSGHARPPGVAGFTSGPSRWATPPSVAWPRRWMSQSR